MATNRASRAVAVLSTAASEEQALQIARALVGERLAACVNIVAPIRSIYRWRDAIEDDRECMLVIKTRAGLVMRVEGRVKELHSYEVPEVIALPISAGSRAYLRWLLDSTSAGRVRRKEAR
jgi:periplasmic divalent cation tolerance protein